MSTDLEQRLHDDLATLDHAPLAAGWRADEAAQRATRRINRRRRATGGVLAASIVVLGAVGIWARRASDETAQTPSASPAPTSAPAAGPPAAGSAAAGSVAAGSVAAGSVAEGTWRSIAADPRGAVLDSTAAWADGEVLVVGGRTIGGEAVIDAATYDPARDEWEQVADPPTIGTSSGAAGGLDSIAVWTGDEVLLVGGSPSAGGPPAPSGVAYDPTADAWRRIAAAPRPVDDRSPWAWTGSELMIWPPNDEGAGSAAAPIAYDPGTDRWRLLPAPPLASRAEAASVWTGTEWLVWGGDDGDTAYADGAAYDPTTEEWRTLAAAPLSPRRARGVWTGSELLVAAGSTGGEPVTGNGALAHADGAAYDPAADAWRPIADGPAHPGFEPVWTGTRLLLFAKGGVVAYDPATDRWADGCCSDPRYGATSTPVWTGDEALLIGSVDAVTGGVAFRPAP